MGLGIVKCQLLIADWPVSLSTEFHDFMNADDLKKRTKQFALRVLKLVAALPNSVQGRTISGQLARSGTSVGSNYRAACRARSKPEFIAKIGIVEEEADESAFWMELIIEDELLKTELVEQLLAEAHELAKIMASSRISASQALKNTKAESAIGNRKSAMTYG